PLRHRHRVAEVVDVVVARVRGEGRLGAARARHQRERRQLHRARHWPLRWSTIFCASTRDGRILSFSVAATYSISTAVESTPGTFESVFTTSTRIGSGPKSARLSISPSAVHRSASGTRPIISASR